MQEVTTGSPSFNEPSSTATEPLVSTFPISDQVIVNKPKGMRLGQTIYNAVYLPNEVGLQEPKTSKEVLDRLFEIDDNKLIKLIEALNKRIINRVSE